MAAIPAGLLLTVATNALRIAHTRRAEPGYANANRNALLSARFCLDRLLAGPELVDPRAIAEAEALCRETRA